MQSADRTNKEEAEKGEPISDRTEENVPVIIVPSVSERAARNATAFGTLDIYVAILLYIERAAQRNDSFDRHPRHGKRKNKRDGINL